ncbi:MAG: phosphonoacetaldehyde reductase [Gammaproteobacteria bacterium]|nr:phosphonoacetaldehyde reductase [Gammaproteobacteria bacterium]
MIPAKYKKMIKLSEVEVTFNCGGLKKVTRELSRKKVLVLVTESALKRQHIRNVLSALDLKNFTICSSIEPNPDIESVNKKTLSLKENGFEHIVAIGGGSVIDTGKALSVTLNIGEKKSISQILAQGKNYQTEKYLPLTAIPTTAGTGSETTPFATLWDRSSGKKYSLTNKIFYPKNAVLIPELTLSLPPKQTLYTALDTLSHALESIWNKKTTEDIRVLSESAITLIVKNLPKTLIEPNVLRHRESLQLASFLAGIAISRTKTAIAHSISYPLTGHHGVPHGLACSFTLLELLKRVKKEEFQPLKDSNLTKNLESMLMSLNLKNEMLRYVTNEQIKCHIPEMINRERADNFVLEIDEEVVSDIVRNSL